jgi:hypothetical protein
MNPPSPVKPIAIGTIAKIVASAVIRIGRRRRLPPSTTAVRTSMPCARYLLTRSISTIALVTTMPTSISSPISAGSPSGVSVSTSMPNAPVAANGMDTSRISGCAMLRNVATMITKTIAIAASNASPRSPNASCWSALTPPME